MVVKSGRNLEFGPVESEQDDDLDSDEAPAEYSRPLLLSDALRFGDRTRAEPMVDRRLQFDFAHGVEAIGPALIEAGPAVHAEWRRCVAAFTECVRAVFDPTFTLDDALATAIDADRQHDE